MPSSFTRIPADFTQKADQGLQRDRTWFNTPGYHGVPKSQLPVNAYTDDRRFATQLYGDGAWKVLKSTGQKFYDLTPGYVFTLSDLMSAYNTAFTDSNFASTFSDVQDKLLLECLKELSDSKFNLAVAAAEAGKTTTHILHTAERVMHAWIEVRRRNFRLAAEVLGVSFNSAHKSWLEYKYGWMPLLMDVKGAAEHFAQHVVGRPIRLSARRKKTFGFRWSSTTDYGQAYGTNPAIHGTYTRSLTGTYTCTVKLEAEVSNPNLAHLQQLGLTNPALVAWELIPFSFVADWFISVGDYLQGLTALQGLSLRREVRSNVNDLTLVYEQPATVTTDVNYTYTNSRRHYEVHQRAYGRGPLDVNPLLIFPPTKFQAFSFEKLLTGLTLLKGNVRAFDRASVLNPSFR